MTIESILTKAVNGRVYPKELQAEETPATNFKFKPLSLRELLAMPPKQWVIEQVLGAGDVAMIYGQPGSAKTFVQIDLIFCACLGQQWARRFDIPKPLTLAYCAGEGVSGLPARFATAAQHYGIDNLPGFTFYAVTPSLFYDESAKNDTESIERFVLEWKMRQDAGEAQALDILVIDTLHSATAGADENSARDMGIVLDLCRKATRLLGCAVVLVHHSNKAGTGERGSSAMRGAMDLMIECEAVAGKYSMSCTKLKDGEKWKPQTFDLIAMDESVYVSWDEPNDGEQTDRRKSETGREILRLLETVGDRYLTTKQIAEALGIKPQTASDVISRVVREKRIERKQNERGAWCFAITTEGKEALQFNKPI